MEQQAKYSLETLPSKTLLHYMKKEELVKMLPAATVADLQRQATAEGSKLTAKFLKNALQSNPNITLQLRNSPLGAQAYQKYVANYQRITAPDVRAKSQQVRREMVEPRRGFAGCIATKIDPNVYKECAESYDNPEYQSVSIIPSAALKQSVYRKTGNQVLASKATHISDLPRGLRAYIRDHPLQYQDYLEELHAQGAYLKSVSRGVHEEQRDAHEEHRGAGGVKRGVVGEGQCKYELGSFCPN
jgi:hypothetical protein